MSNLVPSLPKDDPLTVTKTADREITIKVAGHTYKVITTSDIEHFYLSSEIDLPFRMSLTQKIKRQARGRK